MPVPTFDRDDVLRFRFRRQQLDRDPGSAKGPTDVDVLDYGVQDTGAEGASWALTLRGAPSDADAKGLVMAWTLRGAPHVYRRSDLAAVVTASAPWSEADASKRVINASQPLKAAGIPTLDALQNVADHLRDIVTEPTVKGVVSSRLTAVLDQPYLRFCKPCNATHIYEMPFRLAALQAGLELEPGTSPPVLRRIPGRARPGRYRHLAGDAAGRFDVVRNHLRFYGPARVVDVATFLDSPVAEVNAHWPEDAVEVAITGSPSGGRDRRFVLAADVDAIAGTEPAPDQVVRLVGGFDPVIQLRDRELLVPDAARRKELWPTLGRPGAIMVDGEVRGTWRPKSAGRRFTVAIHPWGRLRAGEGDLIDEQAERLAAHREVTLTAVERV